MIPKKFILKELKNSLPNLKLIQLDVFKLVEFTDLEKPVVYEGKVYQICVLDWDGDLILKDDSVNGNRIIKLGFSKNQSYEDVLLDVLPLHPFNQIKQICQNNVILEGNTVDLQKLINNEL